MSKPSTSSSMPHQQSLLKFLNKKIEEKVKSSRADAIITVRQYLERPNAPQDSDPLEYWKNNENEMQAVKACAMRFFCVPATSTESERLYSKAGLTVSEKDHH
ncbi:PREDICTED: uncharacterized protein LOC108357085 [Rhagoletis zephyria]|nr:PREDICTED: uncharacterized protein LOC108357085 [Rhagoletis zephyria]